jgi:hypothetical protein
MGRTPWLYDYSAPHIIFGDNAFLNPFFFPRRCALGDDNEFDVRLLRGFSDMWVSFKVRGHGGDGSPK